MQLFISDLDGTLLNTKAQISSETAQIINSLIEKGLNFSIATARSVDTARDILKPLNLKLPVILDNGAFIYDIKKNKYILSNYLDRKTIIEVLKIFKSYNVSPIIYRNFQDIKCEIYYRGIFCSGEKFFIENSFKENDRRLKLVNDFTEDLVESLSKIIAIGSDERLRKIYEAVKSIDGVTVNYYKDVYSKEYFLEISNKKSSKKEGVRFIKNYVKADKLICFGDNLNDCAMFEEADLGYAVKNAAEGLKEMASGVIGMNEENGVADFLKNYYFKKLNSNL